MGGDFLPSLAMVLLQVGFAGMNITSKLAMDSGMNPLVMVAYRQIFATIVMVPLAFFCERKTRPRITKSVLLQIFLCSVLGATLNQCFYFLGLKHSTPTVACAISNLLPAMTFVMALPFGMERVEIKRKEGMAKVSGTVLCVGGAMLMSFYKGSLIKIGESAIHWRYVESMREGNSSHEGKEFLGPLLVCASNAAWAGWFILQAKMSKTFTAPYTSSGLMCFMASIQCGVIALFADHTISGWSLALNIRLVGAIYAGVVGSALAFSIMSWCIQRRGPLYVSMFSPLLLIIVAIIGWALLEEKIYVGTAVGSILIVVGLYAVLWGKEKEMSQVGKNVDVRDSKSSEEEDEENERKYDVALQLPVVQVKVDDDDCNKERGF